MLGNQRDAWICCLGVMFHHIPYMLLWFAANAAVGTEVAEDAEVGADSDSHGVRLQTSFVHLWGFRMALRCVMRIV